MNPVCDRLKKDFPICSNNLVSTNIPKSTEVILNDEEMNKQNASFMCSQLLKQILLDIPQTDAARRDMLDEWRLQYVDNNEELANIEEFDKNYRVTQNDEFSFIVYCKAKFTINIREQFENADPSKHFIYTSGLLQDTQTKFSAAEQIPYKAVAASVPNTDDETLQCSTFRSWTIGLLFVTLISVVNQFLFFRSNPLSIGSIIAQVLSLPVSKLMAKILPSKYIRIWKWRFSLNPGPFNMKEHTLITVMANTAAGG
ncbi:unnamed protein product, partial [Didymodactylos carnosus]